MFLANGRVDLGLLTGSLIVADGDVVIPHAAELRWSVVIASGSVTAPAAANVIVDNSRVYAGGSIALPDSLDEERSVFRAGGTVRIGARLGHKDQLAPVVEGAAGLPFGVRFVALDDFGVRAEPAAGGVAVAAVEPWSPLTRSGVRRGDVVTRVGFDAVRTADDLRRALRRGLFEESLVLHVARGGERLTRVVFLAGLPVRP